MTENPFNETFKTNLQYQLDRCAHPAKGLLKLTALVFLVMTALTYGFLSSGASLLNILKVSVMGTIITTAFLTMSYLDNLSQGLDTIVAKFFQYQADSFKLYAESSEELIHDFLLSYDHGTVDVQFEYQEQPEHLSISKDLMPQPYANQRLVIVAKHGVLPERYREAYHQAFDTTDLALIYNEVIQKQLKNSRSTFWLSKDNYNKLYESPVVEKTSFHLAVLITNRS